MAVIVMTRTPNKVLSTIKAAIDKQSVVTWKYDSDGDFSHTPEQWKGKAWMRPKILEDRIIFRIIRPQDKTVSVGAYAVYHGRFVEMLLRHADDFFTEVTSTAAASNGDLV